MWPDYKDIFVLVSMCMSQSFFILLSTFLGFAFGSFLSTWAVRGHALGKTHSVRSYCDSCQRQLSWFELFPLFSYLILRKKCRACKRPISSLYFFTEGVVGVLFGFFAWFHLSQSGSFFSFSFLRDIISLSVFIIIFLSDMLFQKIPMGLTFGSAILIGVLQIALGRTWQSLLLGVVITSSFFLLQFLISRGQWIGFGDSAVGVLMGVVLGFPVVLVALFFSYSIGAGVNSVLLIMKKVTRKSRVPFACYLTVGTLVSMIFGREIIDWYLHFL